MICVVVYCSICVCCAAVGCAPVKAPVNSWSRVTGHRAVVQCNSSSEAWFLTCRGTTWVGHVGNCTDSTVAYHTGFVHVFSATAVHLFVSLSPAWPYCTKMSQKVHRWPKNYNRRKVIWRGVVLRKYGTNLPVTLAATFKSKEVISQSHRTSGTSARSKNFFRHF